MRRAARRCCRLRCAQQTVCVPTRKQADEQGQQCRTATPHIRDERRRMDGPRRSAGGQASIGAHPHHLLRGHLTAVAHAAEAHGPHAEGEARTAGLTGPAPLLRPGSLLPEGRAENRHRHIVAGRRRAAGGSSGNAGGADGRASKCLRHGHAGHCCWDVAAKCRVCKLQKCVSPSRTTLYTAGHRYTT